MSSQPSNQSSQPPAQQSDNEKKFSNWFELLTFLFKDKQGIRILGFLLGFLGVVTLILGIVALQALKWMQPEEIEVTTKLGTISIKSGETQNAIFSLSPNGGDEDTPWVGTGIQVKKGDVIQITANGRVNTSIKRVIATTLNPEIDERTWVSPSGLKRSLNNIYFPIYDQEKLLPDQNNTHYGFGMLLAAVKKEKDQVIPEDIAPFPKDNSKNKFIKFTAKYDGELVLTVNDIWLEPTDQEIYAPPFTEDNYKHYLQLAEFEAVFKEDFNSWSEPKKRQKAEEQYQKRLKGWDTIENNNNWNIWYDDNIGSFSVSIAINSTVSVQPK